MTDRDTLYRPHRFPADIIAHAVWLYFRFPLSLRMVEDMLAARGIIVSHQTIRLWAEKFGLTFANEIRRRSSGRLGDKWHLDEASFRSVARSTGSGALWIRTVSSWKSRCKTAAIISQPLIVTQAIFSVLNPITGLINCFSLPRSASTTLFRHLISRRELCGTFACGLQLRNSNAISRGFVGVDGRWLFSVLQFIQGLAEKASGRLGIPGRRQIEINRVAEFVDGLVKIRPLSSDLHSSFIEAPTR